jgi:hypothetical protein
VTAPKAATAAENKPVYDFGLDRLVWVRGMPVEDKVRTYEDENAFGILLPAFCHLIVFFFRHLSIHVEERSRAVSISRMLPVFWYVEGATWRAGL